MKQQTVRLTTAEALVRYLNAQYIQLEDGAKALVFGCVFGIFGHGNVTVLAKELFLHRHRMPVWRGQNEQTMALAAIGYAKANRRRRMAIATTSVGPGAANMLTAAAVAHANRLPILMLCGDTFTHRLPDPVLQQIEHFHNPNINTNDAFKPVVRYWDRITHPAQLLQTLPQVISNLLDDEMCGPVFLGLPQDIQGQSFDFPEKFFKEKIHQRYLYYPESAQFKVVVERIKKSQRPVIIAGGGVHFANAYKELADFAEAMNIPVVETTIGRCCLLDEHASNVGPIGITGCDEANQIVYEADLILAVGTRLQDFTTGSWTVFASDTPLVMINVSRYDNSKHDSIPLRADAKIALNLLKQKLVNYRSANDWGKKYRTLAKTYRQNISQRIQEKQSPPTYANVVGVVNRHVQAGDSVITAAGGLPGEVSMNWRTNALASLDIEYGYSCMGYEVAAGWGAAIAKPNQNIFVLVGDGSYLMHNSELFSSVLAGHKIIVIICDNGGFAVIDRLQRNTGHTSFNNQLKDCMRVDSDVTMPAVDFVAHAAALGAQAHRVETIQQLDVALQTAKLKQGTQAIVINTHPDSWSPCDCWWEVGLTDQPTTPDQAQLVSDWNKARDKQRQGI